MKFERKDSLIDADVKFTEKIGYLSNYLAMAKSLNAVSSLDHLPEIFKLLAQREGIIKEIDSLGNLSAKNLPDNGRNPSREESLAIHQRLKEILSEIEFLDNQVRQKFISWREELKKELMTHQLTFKTLHTYARTIAHQVEPRFLDLRR